MTTVTLALHAMATRFEMVLHGENPWRCGRRAKKALAEVERLEAQLSLYRDSSEIAHLNARAAQGPVRVTPGLFALFEQARGCTGRAAARSTSPSPRWSGAGGSWAATGRIAGRGRGGGGARQGGHGPGGVGPGGPHGPVRRAGVMLDLGAIGKGYAIERAADVLREAGVTSALVHGGTSTVYGLGHPPEAECWKIAVESPRRGAGGRAAGTSGAGPGPPGAGRTPGHRAVARRGDVGFGGLGTVLSGGGKDFGHVLDPRTGCPVAGAVLAAVVLPSATETDALSTALLVRGLEGKGEIVGLREGMKALVAAEEGEGFRAEGAGIAIAGSKGR